MVGLVLRLGLLGIHNPKVGGSIPPVATKHNKNNNIQRKYSGL